MNITNVVYVIETLEVTSYIMLCSIVRKFNQSIHMISTAQWELTITVLLKSCRHFFKNKSMATFYAMELIFLIFLSNIKQTYCSRKKIMDNNDSVNIQDAQYFINFDRERINVCTKAVLFRSRTRAEKCAIPRYPVIYTAACFLIIRKTITIKSRKPSFISRSSYSLHSSFHRRSSLTV
jgi:hypothetical protein